MLSFASRVRRVRLAFTLAALGALGTGCAQPSRYSSTASVSPTEAIAITSNATATKRSAGRTDVDIRSRRYTILRSDFAGVPAHNAYEIVFRVRPEFLRSSSRRTASAISAEPVVYIDAMRSGSLSTLTEIPAESVMQITYLTPVEAMLFYGPTHGAGAIVVRTNR